jgi:hypothetical protein
MAELVDAADLKSADGNVVGVQVPLPPSLRSHRSVAIALSCCGRAPWVSVYTAPVRQKPAGPRVRARRNQHHASPSLPGDRRSSQAKPVRLFIRVALCDSLRGMAIRWCEIHIPIHSLVDVFPFIVVVHRPQPRSLPQLPHSPAPPGPSRRPAPHLGGAVGSALTSSSWQCRPSSPGVSEALNTTCVFPPAHGELGQPRAVAIHRLTAFREMTAGAG